jgi:tetratricopeptide (TPR) repeat protein
VTARAPRRELTPSDKDTLRAVRALAMEGKLAEAAGAARAALDSSLRHPFLFNVIAMELESSGRLAEAVGVLDGAIEEFPDDLACLQARGLCLLRLEQPEAARDDFERVVGLKPDFAPGFTALGQACEATGELPAAESRYRRALALEPANIMAEAGLASVLGRRGDHDEARERALRVLEREPNYPPAAMVVAEADVAQKRPADAASRMRALVTDPRVTDVERSLALSVLGDALDRQGDATTAFAAYSDSNDLRRAHYAPQYPERDRTLTYARSLLQWFRQHPARDLLAVMPPEVSESPAIGHAFLIGFPRSGTTLLEQVLACHPLVVSLEERETLQDAVSAFMKSPADLARLGLTSESEMLPFRRKYWQRVTDASVTPNGKLFVDKHPLNGLKLPLIARLFPEAKILLAIRDPRDVVLSCFRRRFRMSAPYYEMLSLESAAAFYDCVMQITHELIDQLQLRVHVVQLERLIARFQNEMGGVCTFLELSWNDRMLEFAAGARERGVATASGAQLSKGLNAGGVGEWRRYRDQLAPVLPTLDKWAARFGYEPG